MTWGSQLLVVTDGNKDGDVRDNHPLKANAGIRLEGREEVKAVPLKVKSLFFTLANDDMGTRKRLGSGLLIWRQGAQGLPPASFVH